MTFLRRWWPVLILGIACLALVVYVNHLRGRATSAEADRDRAALRLAGANAVHEASAAVLRAEVASLLRGNALLQIEIDRIKGALPGADPFLAGGGSTGPLRPRPGVPPSGGTPPPTVAGGGPGAPQACAAPPPCLLTAEDQLDIRVAFVGLRGDSGAAAVAMTAEAWRLGPDPVLLFGGPVTLNVSMKDPGDSPGWGVGAVVVGGRSGYWAGPLLSPPPVHLWGLEGSLLVAAGVGGGGEWGGLAGVLARW